MHTYWSNRCESCGSFIYYYSSVRVVGWVDGKRDACALLRCEIMIGERARWVTILNGLLSNYASGKDHLAHAEDRITVSAEDIGS